MAIFLKKKSDTVGFFSFNRVFSQSTQNTVLNIRKEMTVEMCISRPSFIPINMSFPILSGRSCCYV